MKVLSVKNESFLITHYINLLVNVLSLENSFVSITKSEQYYNFPTILIDYEEEFQDKILPRKIELYIFEDINSADFGRIIDKLSFKNTVNPRAKFVLTGKFISLDL